MFELKSHLKRMVEAHAPSGHEAPLRELLREDWETLVNDFAEDGLGSLIGIKRAASEGEAPKRIMLAAHMDEIGMMVRDIVDGFIFVHRINGVDNRVMLAQPVLVHGKDPLPGVIAAAPPHLLSAEDRRKYPSFDELIVDVGLPAKEVEQLVQLGDLITPDAAMIELQGGHLAAKSMDDRACIAAMTACLNHLQSMTHDWDVYATATVQEETGLRGAKTAAYQIQPDIAIALDVTFASQPGADGDETSELGGGPVLSMGPNFHEKLREKIKATAKNHEMTLQEDVITSNSGTDAWAIQISRDGVPTALLSIPIRNMHSPVETVNQKDIERTGRLLAHFINELEADFLSVIDWDDLKTEEANS